MVDRISSPVFLKRQRTAVLGVFLTSVTIFATFLLMAPESIMNKPCSDCAGWYYPVAENLAAGKGLVVGDNDRPALDRPPGHVLLLSGAFTIGRAVGLEKVAVVYVLNVLLLSFAACLLFRISELFWGVKGGLVSAGLWSTSPFVLWFLNQPFSEVPFFVCIFSAAWLFVREQQGQEPGYKKMFIVGTVLGIAILIRPIGIALVIPFVICLGLMRRRVACKSLVIGSIAIVCGAWVVLAPWQAYLFNKTGSFVFLSDSVHGHRSVVEGLIFGIRSEEYKVDIPLSPDIRQFMEEMHSTVFSYEQTSGGVDLYGPGAPLDIRETTNVLKIAATRLGENVTLALRFFWLKVSRSWYGTDSHRNERLAGYLQIFYLTVCGLGLIETMRRPQTRMLALLVSLMVLYFWAFSVAFTPLVRYMIPALGFLFLLAPGAFASEKTRGQ